MPKPKPKGRNDGHETNYSEITKNIIIGSDLCQGKVCPVHHKEFEELDICHEINLSIERKEIPPERIDSYTWLPVVDGYSPNQDQFDLGTIIINEAVNKGKRVYVHCKNGHGRSPTLVAAYLIRYKGVSVDDAIMRVAKKRKEIHVEDSQIQELQKFARRIKKS